MSTASKEYLNDAIDYMDQKYKESLFQTFFYIFAGFFFQSYQQFKISNYLTVFLQNVLFYVLSDDIEEAKNLLEDKIQKNFPIKFPGTGIDHRPGM